MTDCGVHVNAGPEIGVASTKAYTSQFITLLMIGLVLSDDVKSKQARRNQIIDGLSQLPDLIRTVLKSRDLIKDLSVNYLMKQKSILVMGRGFNNATCLEGALKIKELTYLHSEGIQSGELKHGPLALIDSQMPVIMVIAQDNVHAKCLNALEQVMARHGRPLVICQDNDPAFDANNNGKYRVDGEKGLKDIIRIPYAVDAVFGILSVIPLQLMSFEIACGLNLDVDQPRNLAKSVTVE